ncbi:MAG: MGMT family protein [Armatimonadota bacterium]
MQNKSTNSFFYKVYETVARIPSGKVAAYGQIAELCGNPRGARTVGWAMHSIPAHLNLPCHRVVNASGRLAPDSVFGGYDIQRSMLESEGITFKDNGCIDMTKHQW